MEQTLRCNSCDKDFPLDEILYSTNGRYKFCTKCMKRYESKCVHCGEIHCSLISLQSHCCDKCTKTLYYKCPRCNYYHQGEPKTYKKNLICHDCFQTLYYRDNVLAYNSNPSNKKYGNIKKNSFLFGFELEIEAKDQTIILLEKFINFLKKKRIKSLFYFKHDGSLCNGFEIVSKPMTYEFFKEKIPIKELIEFLNKNGVYTDPDSSGLHFHLNRDLISMKTFNKMKLFYNNNYNNLLAFTRRPQDKLEHFCNIENYTLHNYAKYSERLTTQNKYQAIRYCENKNTIEHRIFRGTLNYKNFLGNLEFTHALFYFVEQHSFIQCTKENSWNTFIEWIKKEKQYKNLLSVLPTKTLTERGLLTEFIQEKQVEAERKIRRAKRNSEVSTQEVSSMVRSFEEMFLNNDSYSSNEEENEPNDNETRFPRIIMNADGTRFNVEYV